MGPLSMVLNMCHLFFSSSIFLSSMRVVFGVCFKMNFRIHTIKEKLDRGILLNLKGSVHFKNLSHIIVSFL